MKKIFAVVCIFSVSSLSAWAGGLPKTEKPEAPSEPVTPAAQPAQEPLVKPAEAKPALTEAPVTSVEPQSGQNIIVTRYGAEIPEQPELEPAWGADVKRAWPYWRENYWIDRGPWPGANQGVFYRKEQPKPAGAEMATLPPEGITPISPEGAVQEPLIKQAAPVVASKTPANYTVKKGDCLWFIAGKVYGNPLKWPKIYKANKGKIKNPDRIDPGQVLEIPPL